MATLITKNSSTASAVPLAADLTQGELAVNVTDKKLYTKNSGGSVVQVGGDVVGPASSTDNAFTRFDSTTGKLLQNSTGATLSDTGAAVFTGSVDIAGNSTAGSNIKLYEDTDNGTNYVAFKAPDTIAANVTWTLPATDGSSAQVLSTNGSGTLSWATAGGGGKVLQVVQGTKSGSTFTTSATYSTSNVFATITPTLSTSKVMVIASSPCCLQTGQLKISLYRGTSGNGSGSQVVEIGNGNVSSQNLGSTVNWLDSPASTSALSYTIMQQSTNGSSLVGFVGDLGGTASILLLEIAA